MADSNDDWGWSNPQPPSPGAATPPQPAPTPTDWAWGASQKNAAPQAPADPNALVEKGMALPVGWDAQGNPHFDSDAGALGLAKRTAVGAAKGIWSGLTLPGDVATGVVDPNSQEAVRRSLDMAAMAAPDGAVTTAKKVLAPPATDVLKSSAKVDYGTVLPGLDVRRAIAPTADMAQQAQQEIYGHGIGPGTAPGVHDVLNGLQNPGPNATDVPLSALVDARRQLGRLQKPSGNGSQEFAAGLAQKHIDNYIANPDPASVVSGPADAAADIFNRANGNYAAAKRSETITKGEDTAGLNAAAVNSGQNVGNSIRQRAKAIITNPKASFGYTPEELAALRSVVVGTIPSNTLRTAGNVLGGGGGMHSWITGATAGVAGAQELGPYGAAAAVLPPLLGNAAKRADAALTSGRMQTADELVRSRSPLAREQQAAAPVVTSNPAPKAAVMKGAVVGAAAPATEADSNVPAMTPEEARRYLQSQPEGATFARGGAVKRKSHEELVSRLMTASEQAKAATKRDTKSLLSVPDNSIAKALAVAQRAI